MDPVGPWYASNYRLGAGSATSTFQAASSGTSSEFVTHHLSSAATHAVPPATTSQLLLQAAHTTATLAGQPSPFNPGGFLSPPPVGYDVFSPLFHHSNPKQGHYVTQHRQVLAQAQTVTETKQNSAPENNVSTLGENYSSAHQPTFFEHQTVSTSPNASTLTWTHQSNSQLPSPFGILPHESVVPSSPGPPSTKSGSYENFNVHFTGSPINNINAQITSPITTAGDFKSSNYEKKITRPSSPVAVKSAVTTSQSSTGQTFFQQVPTTYNSETLASNYSSNNNQPSNPKVQAPLQHQQSCIVSTPSNAPSKEYRIPQPGSRIATTAVFLNTTARSAPSQIQEKQPSRNSNFASPPNKTSNTQQTIQTKAQSKIYPELSHNDLRRTEHENSQSSPISFSIMDSRNINYNTTTNCNNTTNKISSDQRTQNNNLQHTQQFHVLNQQQATRFETATTPYRHYSAGSTSDSEYHHPGRSKSAASTDSAYSSNTSTHNGPDCGVVVPRRPSPLQAHSQASPLGHVPSPAYPVYNSPMTTMSSPSPLQQHAENNGNQCSSAAPYKTVQQQMTPPSPLDVTVPRPSSQGQVAYSSVITRALGSTENNKNTYNTENRTYERQQEFPQSQKQQVCWENDNRHSNASRKYAVTTTYGTNTEINTQMATQQQPQRVITVAERQQSYFDSNQVNLQDLSGCRGDPMSIVKNLQTLHQGACQIQQQPVVTTATEPVKQEERRKPEAPKKKKNFEKGTHSSPLNEIAGTAVMSEYLSRIPPPAHHNTNQQQQNGYFDFDRWNLPPPPSKMFSSSPGAFSSQTTLHHSSNFVGNPAHQPQPLMVTHHHAAPPLTYFPAFHISPGHHPHHPHEFQSSVEITPLAFGDNESQNTSYTEEIKDEKPKVIVPDIEEELGFLQQHHQPVISNQNEAKMKGSDPNSGFMTSYLKFLQGERDPSPEPAIRGGRKASWNRSKPYFLPEPSKSLDGLVNGDVVKTQDKSKEMPQIDYANDPRYFPLPKERKNKNFDSSDDGFTSDDDFPFGKKKPEKKSNNIGAPSVSSAPEVVKVEPKAKKGRPIKPGGPTDRKRKAAALAAAAAAAAAAAGGEIVPLVKAKKLKVDPLSLPRRETSRRKAKEKSSVKKLLDQEQGIDYFDNDEELGDSDSDPAWTPAAKLAGDEEEKRKKRGRPVISKRSRKVMDEDGYSSGDIPVPKKSGRKKNDMYSKHSKSSKLSCKIDEKLLAAVSDEDIDISPFKRSMDDSDDASGEFVMMKTDLGIEYPPLWRIDGKTLLQKYEPFQSNGKTLYRNISTYSGWAPQNRHIYQQVPVKICQQDKLETIVEFLRDEMIVDDRECIDRSMKETEKYQDNFEVYIQTLISQALDSNFLTEIFQEQDDYFLSNVKTVDDVTEDRKRRLLSTTIWRQSVVSAISTWPCLNVLKDLPSSEYKGKVCAGCQKDKVNARVLLYGQPYNGTTLEGSPPDPSVPQEKDFLFCRVCQTKVAVYNKVSHQKYLMFLECMRRVSEKRMSDPNKDTTIILNELLADETWLNQLFKEVRSVWADIDSMQHQAKTKSAAASGSQFENSKSSPQTVEDANTTSHSQIAQKMDNDSQSILHNCQGDQVAS